MIKEEKINGKTFVAQTTYYVYETVGDRVAGKAVVTTSDENYFEQLKQRQRDLAETKNPRVD